MVSKVRRGEGFKKDFGLVDLQCELGNLED
jgi:hypothetical protein